MVEAAPNNRQSRLNFPLALTPDELYSLDMKTTRRFERGESYTQFVFEGAYAKMRNTLLERDEMTRTEALDRIARLEAAGWVETDPC